MPRSIRKAAVRSVKCRPTGLEVEADLLYLVEGATTETPIAAIPQTVLDRLDLMDNPEVREAIKTLLFLVDQEINHKLFDPEIKERQI